MFPRRSTFPPRDLFNFYFATHIDVARVPGQPRMDTNEQEHFRASLPDADGSVLTTDYTNRTDLGAHATRVLVSATSPEQSYHPTKDTKAHRDVLNQEQRKQGTISGHLKLADQHTLSLMCS